MVIDFTFTCKRCGKEWCDTAVNPLGAIVLRECPDCRHINSIDLRRLIARQKAAELARKEQASA